MGVNMGEGFLQVPDASNPKGYYEDLRWQSLNKELAGHGYSSRRVPSLPARHEQRYRALFEKCALAPLWGVKAPRLAFVFQHLPALCPCELRVVHVVRNLDDVYASMQRHSEVAYSGRRKMSLFRVQRLIDNWQRALLEGLGPFDGPVHLVSYDRMVRDPEQEIGELAGFCYDGMEIPDVEGAVQWVDPELWHQRSSCPRSTASEDERPQIEQRRARAVTVGRI